MDRARGYTLIELMMVVVIIGILAALAMPTIHEAMADDKLTEASLQAVGAYRTGRYLAMSQSAPVIVVASAAGNGQWWVIPTPPALRQPGVALTCNSINWAAIPMPPTEIDLGAGTGPGGVAYNWAAYGITAAFNMAAPVVCFTPMGRAYVSSGIGGPYRDAQNAAPGGAVLVSFQRPFGGMPRWVVVPVGATARMRKL